MGVYSTGKCCHLSMHLICSNSYWILVFWFQQEHPCLISMQTDLRALVFDEADRLVESQHFAELGSILKFLQGTNKSGRPHESKKKRQTFVFSATLTFVHGDALIPGTRGKKRKHLDTNAKLGKHVLCLARGRFFSDTNQPSSSCQKAGTSWIVTQNVLRLHCMVYGTFLGWLACWGPDTNDRWPVAGQETHLADEHLFQFALDLFSNCLTSSSLVSFYNGKTCWCQDAAKIANY